MFNNPLLSQKHWPKANLPDSLYEFFFEKTYAKINIPKHLSFETYTALLDSVSVDPEFAAFWTEYLANAPFEATFFQSLTYYDVRIDADLVETEYKRYALKKVFNSLSPEEKNLLEFEFYGVKMQAYEEIKKGEALRLGCDVLNIRPKVPILPLNPDKGECKLADLPNDVFVKIMQNLDTIDIFRITLVSKRWRNYVYNNRLDLKRAEHSPTTHLLTFDEWVDASWHNPAQQYEERCVSFSWNLIRWYCSLSENLQTVILCHSVSTQQVASFLQTFPNLRHVQLDCGASLFNHCSSVEPYAVNKFSSLEAFLLTYSNGDSSNWLTANVLTSALKLKVLMSELISTYWEYIISQRSPQEIFGNLTSLHVTLLSDSILKALSRLEPLSHLRYFRADMIVSSGAKKKYIPVSQELRNSLHQFISKLPNLEILILNSPLGITNSTIKMLTSTQQRLRFAVLWEYRANCCNISDVEDPDPLINIKTLQVYQEELKKGNPGICLANFNFILQSDRRSEEFHKSSLEFTIFDDSLEREELFYSTGLDHPSMRRRLGVEF